MSAIHGILAAYKETEKTADDKMIYYFALSSKRFEEGRPDLAELAFRRAIHMQQFAYDMRAAAALLRATFEEW